MTVFNLWVVKHGEILYNKHYDVLQGSLDVPLSAVGIAEAKVAGTYLKETNFSHIYSSSLQSASKTAHKIAIASDFKGHVIYDERLKGRKYGECDGKTWTDLKKAASEANTSLEEFCPPGGETSKQLSDRVVSFFGDLCRSIHQEVTCKGAEIPNSCSVNLQEESASGMNQSSTGVNDGLPVVSANVLLVSHSGFIYELFRYMLNDLSCELKGIAEHDLNIEQKATISKFIVSLDDNCQPKIVCVESRDVSKFARHFVFSSSDNDATLQLL